MMKKKTVHILIQKQKKIQQIRLNSNQIMYLRLQGLEVLTVVKMAVQMLGV